MAYIDSQDENLLLECRDVAMRQWPHQGVHVELTPTNRRPLFAASVTLVWCAGHGVIEDRVAYAEGDTPRATLLLLRDALRAVIAEAMPRPRIQIDDHS